MGGGQFERGGNSEKGFSMEWEEFEIGGRENKDGNLVKREKWEEGAGPSHSQRNDRSLETNTRCT